MNKTDILYPVRKMDKIGLTKALPLEYVFHGFSIKATRPRLAILDFMLKTTAPIPAERIAEKLDVGLATVYRTLKFLEESGHVRKSKNSKKPIFYELNLEN